jgi:hypothetical protein
LVMTLTEFSAVVEAPSKWVLNARALLGITAPYSLAAAEHLAIIRLLNTGFDIPLAAAGDFARQALGASGVTRISPADGLVTMMIDVERIRAAVVTRAATVSNTYAPRRPGRRPRRSRQPITSAKQHGIDIGLLKANDSMPWPRSDRGSGGVLSVRHV